MTPSPVPDWVICGGESGSGCRQMDEQWARDLRDKCNENGIAFFMKQRTDKADIPEDLLVRCFPRPRSTVESAGVLSSASAR